MIDDSGKKKAGRVAASDEIETAVSLPTAQQYRRHLASTLEWLLSSECRGGGSAAYRAPIVGWSKPYPETTGYLIPTLLRASRSLDDPRLETFAVRCGEWLVSIQNPDGSWNGGLHPPPEPKPSIFNTAQILLGLLALWRHLDDDVWIECAVRGSAWLESGMSDDGLWTARDYRSRVIPSYYTHALWPFLAVARATNDETQVTKIRRAYSVILNRIDNDGWIRDAGFSEGKPAFTHTIAYTIRGLQEGGRLLGEPRIAEAAGPAIEKLVRIGELAAGRLPGAFERGWKPAGRFVCLTGNVQLAKSILIFEEQDPDLRLVSAAARLTDVVCSSQRRMIRPERPYGRVAGSQPFYGPYMRFRYPNWAAKYHVDALLSLVDRLARDA